MSLWRSYFSLEVSLWTFDWPFFNLMNLSYTADCSFTPVSQCLFEEDGFFTISIACSKATDVAGFEIGKYFMRNLEFKWTICHVLYKPDLFFRLRLIGRTQRWSSHYMLFTRNFRFSWSHRCSFSLSNSLHALFIWQEWLHCSSLCCNLSRLRRLLNVLNCYELWDALHRNAL